VGDQPACVMLAKEFLQQIVFLKRQNVKTHSNDAALINVPGFAPFRVAERCAVGSAAVEDWGGGTADRYWVAASVSFQSCRGGRRR
jgi:hypothetical protein